MGEGGPKALELARQLASALVACSGSRVDTLVSQSGRMLELLRALRPPAPRGHSPKKTNRVRGIYKQRKKWVVKLTLGGVQRSVGSFSSYAAARAGLAVHVGAAAECTDAELDAASKEFCSARRPKDKPQMERGFKRVKNSKRSGIMVNKTRFYRFVVQRAGEDIGATYARALELWRTKGGRVRFARSAKRKTYGSRGSRVLAVDLEGARAYAARARDESVMGDIEELVGACELGDEDTDASSNASSGRDLDEFVVWGDTRCVGRATVRESALPRSQSRAQSRARAYSRLLRATCGAHKERVDMDDEEFAHKRWCSWELVEAYAMGIMRACDDDK